MDAKRRALVRARNDAHDAIQRYDDAHVTTDNPDPAAERLRDTAAELVARIDALLTSSAMIGTD